jgi:hypothetical protein
LSISLSFLTNIAFFMWHTSISKICIIEIITAHYPHGFLLHVPTQAVLSTIIVRCASFFQQWRLINIWEGNVRNRRKYNTWRTSRSEAYFARPPTFTHTQAQSSGIEATPVQYIWKISPPRQLLCIMHFHITELREK